MQRALPEHPADLLWSLTLRLAAPAPEAAIATAIQKPAVAAQASQFERLPELTTSVPAAACRMPP